MPPKRDHKDIMGLKCGVCLGSTNLRPISQAVLLMIRSQVYSEYDIGSCPGKVCSSCDKTLRDRAKNGTASKWKLPGIDLEKIVARRVTRATAGECSCGWCELGHIKGKLLVIKMEELGSGRPWGGLSLWMLRILTLRLWLLLGILTRFVVCAKELLHEE